MLIRARTYVARHHLAILALFVALGGSAYAAVGKNQVDSRSIRDGQVKTLDIKDGAVRSADVLDGSLDEADLAPPLLDDRSIGRSNTSGAFVCDPEGFEPERCGTATVTLDHPARLLMMAGGSVSGGTASDFTTVDCTLGLDIGLDASRLDKGDRRSAAG